jgi:histidinol-phosphate aminotransferase
VLEHGDFFRYPVYDEAYDALRSHLGVPHVLFTAGCHDAIRVVAGSLDRDRNRVLLAMPNYDGYRHYFHVNGIETVRRHRGPGDRHDLRALVTQAVAERCNLVVLANPDPFVGDCFDRGEIEALVDACAERNITVILDEVYAGFGRDSDVALVVDRDNLLVLNSLSKSYGFPGLRVGWVAGAGHAIDRLGCEFPESGISGLSLAMAVRVLSDEDWVRDFRAAVLQNRKALAAALASAEGVEPYPETRTNFLLFRTGERPGRERFWDELLRRGIYVADLNAIPGFEHHYRATVCTHADREKFIDGLLHVARQADLHRGETAQGGGQYA